MASSAKLPDSSTAMALERTRLAQERTLMAWVRTATSMISFGFTIYKFFQFREEKEGIAMAGHLFGPRTYALLMVALGLVCLLLATIAHRRDLNSLRRQYGEVPRSLAALLASAISVFGILVLLGVIFRQ